MVHGCLGHPGEVATVDTVYWPTLRDMYIVLVHAAGLDEHAAALIVRREAQCMIAQKRYEWANVEAHPRC